MQILEFCDVVNLGVDNDPLQHALVRKQSDTICEQLSPDHHPCYAASENGTAIRVLQGMSCNVIRTFATSSRVNVLSAFDAIAKGNVFREYNATGKYTIPRSM